MTTRITGLTISGSEIKIDYSKGGKNKPLYGNWYYDLGSVCGLKQCDNTFTDYIPSIQQVDSSATENTAFYLGTGFYNTYESALQFGCWSAVEKVDGTFTNSIINFGGWGCCGSLNGCGNVNAPNSLCNTNGSAGNSKAVPPVPAKPTASTGPNCVWANNNIADLPSAQQIKDHSNNYNGVSLDIEGVVTNDFTGSIIVNKLKEYKQNNLYTIITVPGNGVAGPNGGMDWFTDVAKSEYLDYICLMYYAILGDTETAAGGSLTTPQILTESLTTLWTTPEGATKQSRFNLRPDQIILGFSFGHKENIPKYITPDILKLASGGISRWAQKGGGLNSKWDACKKPECVDRTASDLTDKKTCNECGFHWGTNYKTCSCFKWPPDTPC